MAESGVTPHSRGCAPYRTSRPSRPLTVAQPRLLLSCGTVRPLAPLPAAARTCGTAALRGCSACAAARKSSSGVCCIFLT